MSTHDFPRSLRVHPTSGGLGRTLEHFRSDSLTQNFLLILKRSTFSPVLTCFRVLVPSRFLPDPFVVRCLTKKFVWDWSDKIVVGIFGRVHKSQSWQTVRGLVTGVTVLLMEEGIFSGSWRLGRPKSSQTTFTLNYRSNTYTRKEHTHRSEWPYTVS